MVCKNFVFLIGNTAIFKFLSVPLKYAGWGGFKVQMDAGLKVLKLSQLLTGILQKTSKL